MLRSAVSLLTVAAAMSAVAASPAPYEIYVTNEISGDLSLINGATLKVEATVPTPASRFCAME